MKHLVLTIIIALFMPFQALSNDKTVTITSSEWAPWTGENLPHNGFVNHVIEEAFGRMGYRVEFKYVPWPRAYQDAIEGLVNATSFWYKSDRRMRDCLYSDPINTERVVFFHLKGTPMPQWEKLEDLAHLKIAVNTGVTYTDEFWDLGRRGILEFHRSNLHKDNFAKLIRKRVDVFPTSKLMGEQILRSHFSKDERSIITYAEKPLTVSNGFLLFGRIREDAELMVKTFNSGLSRLREDGTYQLMYQDLQLGRYADTPFEKRSSKK